MCIEWTFKSFRLWICKKLIIFLMYKNIDLKSSDDVYEVTYRLLALRKIVFFFVRCKRAVRSDPPSCLIGLCDGRQIIPYCFNLDEGRSQHFCWVAVSLGKLRPICWCMTGSFLSDVLLCWDRRSSQKECCVKMDLFFFFFFRPWHIWWKGLTEYLQLEGRASNSRPTESF